MNLQGPKKWFAAKEGPGQEQAIFSGSVDCECVCRPPPNLLRCSLAGCSLVGMGKRVLNYAERERKRELLLPAFVLSLLPARPNCLLPPAAKTGGILIRRKNATRRRRRRRSDVHCSIHCSSLPPIRLPLPASNFLFGSINSCPNFSGRKEGYNRDPRGFAS